MKKLIALVALMLMLGGASAATAAKDDNNGKAGPNGNNDHGLCTAYFNGQKKGHEDGSPGPFAALEEKGKDGQDNDDDGDIDERDEVIQGVYDYCSGLAKGIGGNGDQNGRFTDCYDDSDNDPETPSCSDGAA